MSFNKTEWEGFEYTDAYDVNDTLHLILLVTFYKHKAVPAKVVKGLCKRGFLMPYMMEEDERLAERVFVKLTYKGRKMAQKCEKVFGRYQDDDGLNTPDLYAQAQGSNDNKFIMHHKRYLEELGAGHETRLISSYASDLHDVKSI